MRAIRGNIIVKIDSRQKEKYNLTKDVTIHIPKGFNFNLREDRSSMGYIIDGNGLNSGLFCLVHHLALEPSYHIEAENILTDDEKKEGFKIVSLPIDMVFATSVDGKEWQPCKNFLITLRIFKEYKGGLVGIEPELVKDRLYVVKGEIEDAPSLESNVCVVTQNSAYQIIWHNTQNREESLIRTREREIMAIDHGLTNEVNKGKYLVGLNAATAKPIN